MRTTPPWRKKSTGKLIQPRPPWWAYPQWWAVVVSAVAVVGTFGTIWLGLGQLKTMQAQLYTDQRPRIWPTLSDSSLIKYHTFSRTISANWIIDMGFDNLNFITHIKLANIGASPATDVQTAIFAMAAPFYRYGKTNASIAETVFSNGEALRALCDRQRENSEVDGSTSNGLMVLPDSNSIIDDRINTVSEWHAFVQPSGARSQKEMSNLWPAPKPAIAVDVLVCVTYRSGKNPNVMTTARLYHLMTRDTWDKFTPNIFSYENPVKVQLEGAPQGSDYGD